MRQPAQPMQGVNVVARWIDPATGQPSGASVATSVSGFLFRGNAGNPATGFTDSTGQRFDRFGSDDSTIEGFFDIAGLEIPNGAGSAQYQLTLEPIDPTWSQLVGPYGPWQVQPSGTAQTHYRDCEPGQRHSAGHPHAKQRQPGTGLVRAHDLFISCAAAFRWKLGRLA